MFLKAQATAGIFLPNMKHCGVLSLFCHQENAASYLCHVFIFIAFFQSTACTETTTSYYSSGEVIASPCDSQGCPPVAYVPGYPGSVLVFNVNEYSPDVPEYCPHGSLTYPDDFDNITTECTYYMLALVFMRNSTLLLACGLFTMMPQIRIQIVLVLLQAILITMVGGTAQRMAQSLEII